MLPFRLEEFLRIAGIAALSAFAGTLAFLVWIIPGLGQQEPMWPTASLLMLLLFGAIVWAYTFVPAIVMGTLLHLALRLRTVPRGVVFLLFLCVAASAAYLFPPVGPVWPIAAAAACVAWAAYCFGPLALWNYRYDPVSDIDF